MNCSRSLSSPSTGPHANFPSTITTSVKITSVQIALPTLPANGFNAPSASSANAVAGSAVKPKTMSVVSRCFMSILERGARADDCSARSAPGSFVSRVRLRLEHCQHADDDGEQRRTFDHRGGDDHRG